MTVVGLHPEELFDRLLDGELLPSDAERLRQHLSTCSVCRFEHAARLDFQAEALAMAGLPPAVPLRPLPLAGVVAEAPVLASQPRRRRSRTLLIWGLAAAALISASGAVAAGIAQGKAPWHGLGTLFSESPPLAFSPPKKPKPALATPGHAAESHAATAPSPSPLALGGTPPAAASPPQQAAARPHWARKLGHAEPAKEPASAAKLFGEANQARRSGDIGRASGLYHLLQDQYPGSPEAELSRVTLSWLLLDNGDAQAALVGFERYLAGSSRALEAEALVGGHVRSADSAGAISRPRPGVRYSGSTRPSTADRPPRDSLRWVSRETHAGGDGGRARTASAVCGGRAGEDTLASRSDPKPVCGCNGVSYWNDCLRINAGVPLAGPGQCKANACSCEIGSDCAVPNASCSHLLPQGEMCGHGMGACWVLPAGCPPSADTKMFRECKPPDQGPAGPCLSACQAIASEHSYAKLRHGESCN